MRIIGDFRSLFDGDPAILQVEKTPPRGTSGETVTNGRYVIPLIDVGGQDISTSSYILNGSGEIDGGSVVSEAFAYLLAQNPSFNHVVFNPLLTEDHVGQLDFTTSVIDPVTAATVNPRCSTGRASGGPYLSGQAPNSTAILPQNNQTSPSRPGLLLTEDMDISTYEPLGVDRFQVWWSRFEFVHTHDVASDFGVNAGVNTPALRYIQEASPNHDDLSVYLSPDSGASWTLVSWGVPFTLPGLTTTIRLAFFNRGTDRLYLNSYAVLL